MSFLSRSTDATHLTCLLSYLPDFLPKEFLIFLDRFFQFLHSGFGLFFAVLDLLTAAGRLSWKNKKFDNFLHFKGRGPDKIFPIDTHLFKVQILLTFNSFQKVTRGFVNQLDDFLFLQWGWK